MVGMFNEMTYFNGVRETVQEMLKHYDELGRARTYPHMAAGWAVAGDTPFMWTKQIPSNYGGTRNGVIVSWPKRIKAANEVRSQWHHIIDVAPTILEAANLPEPKSVNGVKQEPIEGVSMLYTFDNAEAESTHKTQYFEIMGNRAIYTTAGMPAPFTRRRGSSAPRKLQEDIWELYDTRNDFSLTNNLAASNAAKLKELQDLFMQEATKNRVLPIDDRGVERVNAATAGRPDLMGERTSLTLSEGHGGDERKRRSSTSRTVRSRSRPTWRFRKGGANGVILAQAGRFGGWSLYFKDGKPNVLPTTSLDWSRFKIRSTQRAGRRQAPPSG